VDFYLWIFGVILAALCGLLIWGLIRLALGKPPPSFGAHAERALLEKWDGMNSWLRAAVCVALIGLFSWFCTWGGQADRPRWLFAVWVGLGVGMAACVGFFSPETVARRQGLRTALGTALLAWLGLGFVIQVLEAVSTWWMWPFVLYWAAALVALAVVQFRVARRGGPGDADGRPRRD